MTVQTMTVAKGVKKKKEKCHFSRIAVRLRAVGEQKSKTAI